MQRHDVNLTSIILRTFIILQLLPIVFSCIYLLNGWTPMSVGNRTARADIVLSAHVLKAFKEKQYRTEARTYTATVKLFEVYKGKKLLRNIPVNENTPNIYNISNFGDRKMCYADVTDGKNYILFLTTYKQRLSAKYDDIFGAATKYTENNVQAVLDQTGTDAADWLEWSSCSKSCGGGDQVRKRNCTLTRSDNCDTATMDRRSCNSFACQEAHDLLSYLGVYKLPLGVYHVHDRPGAFNITKSAKLYSPLTEIYQYTLPQDFSIMLSIKISDTFEGYFFTLSDLAGKQRVAFKLARKHDHSVIRFEYYDDKDLAGENAPEFEMQLKENFWHRFAFGITENSVELHTDCDKVITKSIPKQDRSPLNSNLMMSLGPYFARYGESFEGEIEQLVMSDDSSAAQQQCSSILDHTERAIKDEGNNEIDDFVHGEDNNTIYKSHGHTQEPEVTTQQTTTELDLRAEWTEWSPCSRTCGRGVQTRTQYCGDNVISTCIQAGLDSEQARWCYKQSCEVACDPVCENGGKCLSTGSCFCPRGFSGPTCTMATCSIECLNGGRCVSPGVCTCPVGYTGRFCQTAICEPECGNGGQCVQPGFCSCPYGYMPPNCDPVCVLPCRNGGKCVGHNKCKCKKGYVGSDCSIPVCRRGCYNGGRCVSPNTCACPRGFSGARCHRPVCYPACQNRGRCLYPGVCQCKRGFNGPLCENLVCRKPCQNGGICAGNNRCTCPDGFRGRWCHKVRKYRRCPTCLNGGKCRKRRCRCRKGYTGSRCEKRECSYETYLMPYIQTYRKPERQEVATLCGPWKSKMCIETRLVYVLATRTLYKTAYRCKS
ncbi:protein kinase C-binding protein NELL1-like isoform X1 [Mercenaria mercenaria]|uniref:protein kinase C-binding protein NELL1-like isoform X1 n=1 Tax=Mercenaria mercenaria TaxID=6596 RepID=UPI00234F9494|nr:protein kinase C-binding protein NELL1-like isoform X1 [Mercenaria mercenaria]XP_045207078.2 protein kinase C-binding protein NELL1-like isoform X1 [Mercenaria mercenaria]XP_045207079.2 protein kinase C-binding protein NELL1-like isoform X1 [Mercenaria mercenaria]XP_045207082.2 protein kinase C-binding protein NELL1-like isoform X1 [Mercenaria mercenaria]XP_045207083.2 protein kinase C-binding protein NELL1-like isoform X1 [Mercenaria mercenaria]XP_053408720.1 protein kinase C-binding prote